MECSEQPQPLSQLNVEHPLIKSYVKSGVIIKEIKGGNNPYNAVVYERDKSKQSELARASRNIVFLPGAFGGSEDTSQIGLSILDSFGKEPVKIIGTNSSVSNRSFQEARFEPTNSKRVEQLRDVVMESLNKSTDPVSLVGHSLGAYEGALLVNELKKKGVSVGKLLLIAPPGMEKQGFIPFTKKLLDVLKTPFDVDVQTLWPDPVYVNELQREQAGLRMGKGSIKGVSLTDTDLQTYIDKVMPRAGKYEGLDEKEKKQAQEYDETLHQLLIKYNYFDLIEREHAGLLSDEEKQGLKEINMLRTKRTGGLRKRAQQLVSGVIDGVPLRVADTIRQQIQSLTHMTTSLLGLRQLISNLGNEGTLKAIQSFSDKKIDTKVSIIFADHDIVFSPKSIQGEEAGKLKGILDQVTLMPHAGHFSISADPTRFANLIHKIITG